MYLQQFFIDGLGCVSYLVGCEDTGVAAVIDPDRDVQKYLDSAAAHGLKITCIIETHLHADHVSGNTELAERTGADIYIHKAADAEFVHRKLDGGDSITLGNVELQVRNTPGHTPESITLLVIDKTRAAEPWLALTGDTLFVGDAGRPDLVGADAARDLAGRMYETLQNEYLTLSDGVMILPGHGAGSLCGKSIGAMSSSTLGYERRHNPALQITDRAQYIAFATTDLPEQPGNSKRIKETNRQGPRILGEIRPRGLSVPEAFADLQRGTAFVDLRSTADYKAKHIPGSIHLAADNQLSNGAGFVLWPEIPIVLLLSRPDDYQRVVYSLARVGFDDVIGYLADSLETWEAMRLPVTSGAVRDITAVQLRERIDKKDADTPIVIDVREPWEQKTGFIPGAQLIPLGGFARRANELDPTRPVALVCDSGSRSQLAASLLSQNGFETVYNLLGGTRGWAQLGFRLAHLSS